MLKSEFIRRLNEIPEDKEITVSRWTDSGYADFEICEIEITQEELCNCFDIDDCESCKIKENSDCRKDKKIQVIHLD